MHFKVLKESVQVQVHKVHCTVVVYLLTRAWAEGYSNHPVCVSVCVCQHIFGHFLNYYNGFCVFGLKKYIDGQITCILFLCVLLRVLNVFVLEKEQCKVSS